MTEQSPHNDWRIGLAVTPKMRDHRFFGEVGIVRAVHPESESENIKETLIIELATPRGRLAFAEPSGDWMTA